MVDINLIRQRYVLPLQRKEKREHFLALTAVFMLLLLVSSATIGSIYSFNKVIIRNYSREAEREDARLFAVFLPTAEEQSRRAALKKAVALNEKRVLFAPRLAALSGLMPKGMYITGIRFNGTSVTIRGMCRPGDNANATLALFLKDLNGNKNFIQDGGKLGLESATNENDFLNFSVAGTIK